MENVSVIDINKQLDAETVLLDVREPWEYELCHIDGSISIPMSEITTRINELNPDAKTVVICHHGMRSLQVAQFLETNGFQQIYNMEGGIDAWALEIDNTMERY